MVCDYLYAGRIIDLVRGSHFALLCWEETQLRAPVQLSIKCVEPPGRASRTKAHEQSSRLEVRVGTFDTKSLGPMLSFLILHVVIT